MMLMRYCFLGPRVVPGVHRTDPNVEAVNGVYEKDVGHWSEPYPLPQIRVPCRFLQQKETQG